MPPRPYIPDVSSSDVYTGSPNTFSSSSSYSSTSSSSSGPSSKTIIIIVICVFAGIIITACCIRAFARASRGNVHQSALRQRVTPSKPFIANYNNAIPLNDLQPVQVQMAEPPPAYTKTANEAVRGAGMARYGNRVAVSGGV